MFYANKISKKINFTLFSVGFGYPGGYGGYGGHGGYGGKSQLPKFKLQISCCYLIINWHFIFHIGGYGGGYGGYGGYGGGYGKFKFDFD